MDILSNIFTLTEKIISFQGDKIAVSKVRRIFVEKKKGFDVEVQALTGI